MRTGLTNEEAQNRYNQLGEQGRREGESVDAENRKTDQQTRTNQEILDTRLSTAEELAGQDAQTTVLERVEGIAQNSMSLNVVNDESRMIIDGANIFTSTELTADVEILASTQGKLDLYESGKDVEQKEKFFKILLIY